MANYDAPGLTYDSGVFYDALFLPQPSRKKMARVKLNLDRLSITELIQRGTDIKTAMTGNASFTTPIPSLTNVGTAITALTTANSTYESGVLTQKTNLTNRDNAPAALIALLTQLGGYVEAASAGDEAKIQSAGMGVRAGKTPPAMPGQVANLSLTAGDNDGELDAQWDPVDVAKSYDVETSPDPMTPTSWTPKQSVTKSKAVLLGLPSGTRVWVHVRAVGSGGTGAWSDPAVKTVP
jgi:hypothetical protein